MFFNKIMYFSKIMYFNKILYFDKIMYFDKITYYDKIIKYVALFIIIYNLKGFIKKESIIENQPKKNYNNILKELFINRDKDQNIINYNIIKKKFTKKKLDYKSDDIKNNKTLLIDNKYAIVLYKPKKQSNYNLKDIYNNFFKEKNTMKNDNNNFMSMKDNLVILSESKNNILLDEINNFIIYNFESKKNNYYKIKCKLVINSIKNIKLIITDTKKKFIYDYLENNPIDNNINEYSFILDYNNFDIDDKIYIYIIFYDENNKDVNVDNISIEITENKIYDNNNSILIFNINGKYDPIYLNTTNILDYSKFIDTSSVFFI